MSSRLETWFDVNRCTLSPPLLIAFFLLLEISISARADYNYSLLTKSIEQQRPQKPGAQKAHEVEALEQGKPIERELTAGQSHAYQITLAKGDYLSVRVEQRGIDVAVKVIGPDEKQLLESDSEPRKQGEERVSLVAEVAGSYRLRVEPTQRAAPTGHYEIEVVELRRSTESDRALYEARKLYEEGSKLYRAGKYDKALPLVERALEIRERILGLQHPDVATAINFLAILYRYIGEYSKVEPLHQRALTIWEKALGPEHLTVARGLNNLANLYRERGEYIKAEPLYQRVLSIREGMLGPEHSLVAASLNNLALLDWEKGNYTKAVPLYQRAMAIWEKALGPEHPDVAVSLNNLANVYWEIGEYVMAEPLYERALAIREKALGLEHPLVAASLYGLAMLNRERGDYVKAESFYQRALAIREKAQGPDHPDVAHSLHGLAIVNLNRGDYLKAELLYRRALAIREKALGLEHPDVALSLSNLAALYNDRGEYAKAEPLYQRSLDICERALGPEHPDVAYSLNSIAILRRDEGNYVKAEPLFQRALAIREKVLGPRHPRVAESLSDLAMHYMAKGDLVQAITFQSRANAVTEHNIALNLRTGSERQKLAYLAILSKQTDLTISFHLRYLPNDLTARNLAATMILQRKGRTLDAMSDSFATLRQRFNPQDRALLDRLNDVTAQLARLVLGGPKNAAPVEYQKEIKTLEEEKEALEAEISRRSAEFRANSQPITLASIQAAIPTNAVLLEFASYQPYDVKAARNDKEYGAPRYVAYLLRREGESKWRELGDAKTIDAAIAAFRAALSNPKRRDIKRLARVLDEKVMRPLRSLLGDARQILVSPDGDLNLIPFEALVDEQGRYLIERYPFTYLTSGRDLLRLQVERESKSNPLIVADPIFGQRDQLAKADVAQRRPARRRMRQSVTTGSDLSSIYFAPLMGTELEAREIKSLFPKARVLVREEATEPSLKRAVAPRILHIATHGFFLEDRPVRIGGTRGVRLMRDDGELVGASANVKIENPLLRSGLALAGANWRTDRDDDGILTALEATGLNLWGTQLVVLSACDTGVGVVRTGEGVYGLRRALVLAGSETQVMSLWPVNDYATQRLMKAYYTRLKQGQGRGEALRNVKLTTMRRRGTEHPFYWAGFIQSGKWTELGDKR
jgi:CHAT domain-containing protein/Tfp pilus assembly protein PilF